VRETFFAGGSKPVGSAIHCTPLVRVSWVRQRQNVCIWLLPLTSTVLSLRSTRISGPKPASEPEPPVFMSRAWAAGQMCTKRVCAVQGLERDAMRLAVLTVSPKIEDLHRAQCHGKEGGRWRWEKIQYWM